MNKLILIFLLCSLLSWSNQQYRFYYFNPHLAFYYPFNTYYLPETINYDDEQGNEGIVQSRTFNRGSSGEKRFLGVTINLPPKGGYPSYYYERKTHTVYFTVSSTATVAQFKSCIDSLQFVTSNGRTSTDLCHRRRRSEAQMADSLVEVTPVLPLETSVGPKMPQKRENIIRAKSNLLLSSSLSSPSTYSNNRQRFHSWNHHHPWHNGESNNNDDLDKEVTVTSVATAIGAFTTTIITKSYTLASTPTHGAGPGLLCLPSGYTVC